MQALLEKFIQEYLLGTKCVPGTVIQKVHVSKAW